MIFAVPAWSFYAWLCHAAFSSSLNNNGILKTVCVLLCIGYIGWGILQEPVCVCSEFLVSKYLKLKCSEYVKIVELFFNIA